MNTSTTILTIIAAVLGSTGLATLIQFFVNRHDNRNDKLANIDTKLDQVEKVLKERERGDVRTQMLLLLSNYPDNQSEIMKLAEHYFIDLKGDWYMTTLFNKWLEEKNIAKPEWFVNAK